MRGVHDGSSLLEQAIDAQIAGRAHSAVVVSAGNFADKKWHTKGTVPPNNGTFDVKFNIADHDVLSRYLEVWYPAGAGLKVKVIAPGNKVLAPLGGAHPDGVLPPNTGSVFLLSAQAGGAHLLVHSDLAFQDNKDNRIQITIMGGARPMGEWTAQLINPSVAAGDVDVTRIANEAIGKLLGAEAGAPGAVVDLAARRVGPSSWSSTLHHEEQDHHR